MEKNAKIYVAGHRGLVGSAIVRELNRKGYANIIGRTHRELDLTNQAAVEAFFAEEKPEYVFLCAAKVGGIHINDIQPADFMYINLAIAANVIPRVVPQPIKEEYLLTAPLEKTNEAYALAKISGLKLCEFYNRQYGTSYISVMPCNLYGPGDNYNPVSSHVIPALLRKFHEAKESGAPSVTLWGTGSAMREFLHIDDIAGASVFLMETYQENQWINIGCGTDMKISALAELIREVVGYEGGIEYDASMPDGTPRKLLDSSRLFSLGWRPAIPLREGLEETYRDYLLHKDEYRQ